MRMPFTAAQFFDVFRQYNEAVWPGQLLLLAAALVAVLIAIRARPHAGRMVSAVLAILWLWMGIVYHIGFFRAINPAATLFGAVFIVQGALFAWFGVWKTYLTFHVRRDTPGVVAAMLIVYALILYPALGSVLGHRYPAAPTFGLPCPTTIFTFGLLLWARPPVPRALVVVPAIWAVVGAVGALQLNVAEDFGLLIAGAIATRMIVLRRRHSNVVRMA